MKTIYEVSEQDYGVNRQYGTFEDNAVADALCERVNAYNKVGPDDSKAEVRTRTVFEPGDPIFTTIVLYVVKDDRYAVKDLCPTMYEHWGDISWIRECIEESTSVGAFGRAGTSEEDAMSRLQPDIELLKAEGLISHHRLQLLAREKDDTEERRKHRWD
jgi:hypothetical protein